MLEPRLVVCFFKGPLEDVGALAERTLVSTGVPTAWAPLPGPLGLASIRSHMPPPDAPPHAVFFAATACTGWTGMTSAMQDGWYTLVTAMTRADTACEALVARLDVAPVSYPSTLFECFRNGESVRRVAAWKEDNGWHFTNRGTPLPAEDVSAYSRVLKKHRLNRASLSALLQRHGIDLAGLQDQLLLEARLLTTYSAAWRPDT